MSYVGATGLNAIDDLIEDVNNTLSASITVNINNTSNYVLTTSNILVKRITDEIEHTSNYVKITSNILVKRITDEVEHTSNYVKITSNILEARIKALEGSEGSPGDLNLGIPAIPSTGGVAVAAAIATITGACIANGITVLTLLDILEDKVDLNKTQADKIGGWSSNYSDKVGVWSSDYTDRVGKYGSNYSDKVGIYGSNYTDKVGIFGSNYARDKVGIWSSNYTDLVGKYTSNYTDRVGIFGSNYTDLVGKYTSNYTDKLGIFGSNYTDKVGIYTSNYTDKVGIYTSNYTDLVGKYTSNYTDKLDIYGSNYTDKVGKYTSNYTDKVGIYTSNYTDKLGIYGSNYIDLVGKYTSNYSDKLGIYTSNYSDKLGIYGSNYTDKVGIYTSNYTDKLGIYGSNYTDKLGIYGSNYTDKVGIFGSNYTERLTTSLGVRVDDTSNYVARIITELTTATPALGVRVDNTSNYVERINTELTTASIALGVRVDNTSNYVERIDTALGVRVDNTSNYVERINTELTTASTALGVRVDNTSNYVERINTELTTASTVLGVRVDNTSNYVERINTELTTASTVLGVRVDNTSNYVLSTSNILVGMLNGRVTEFLKSIPKGNYTIKVRGYLDNYTANGVYYISTFSYWYSDRYNGDTSKLNFYVNIPTSFYYKSALYYNAGDQIEFKMTINGANDFYTYADGATSPNMFIILRSPPGIPWGNAGSIFDDDADPFMVLYVFKNQEILKYIAYGFPAVPIGLYNDTFILTLEAGYDYWLTRYALIGGISQAINPIRIKVNNPIFDDATSYIPPVVVKPSTAVPGRKSIPLYKGVSVNTEGNTLGTTTTTLDYELSSGFNYDDTSNIMSVFDGNYNNLTNKPSLITTTDINHTSNYVSRINTDLTTAIGNKQNTLTSTSLATLLNTTTDFVINGSKIDLSQNTSNYVSRINSTLTTAIGTKQATLTSTSLAGLLNTPTDFVNVNNKIELSKHTSNYVSRINSELTTAIGNKQDTLTSTSLATLLNTPTDFVNVNNKIELSKHTSNYVLRLDGHTSNYVARIAATSSASYWTLVPSTTNISYSAGNVGIGTSPTNKLHIYDETNNETKLIIQNNTIITSGALPTEIVVADTISTTIGTSDRVICFPYSGTGTTMDYSFPTTQNLICDILIVGGGGSGSQAHGGGGGAGAVIFMTNVSMSGSYTIKVGKGGVCEVTTGANGLGRKGNDSEIFKTNNNKIVAEGGGGGGQLSNANGGSGGSGGGGDAYNLGVGSGGAATAYTPVLDSITGIKYGNNGGNAIGNPGHGGGGGGAGGVGENALGVYNTGNDENERAHGGVGIKSATISSINYDFKTLFGTNTGVGVIEADGFLYFGGGGGNGRWKAPLNTGEGGNGGLGGGGKGGWGGGTSTPNNGKGYAGTNGTGGGGGGGGDYTPVGGDGGSGIVIIRYRLEPSTSSSLELVRGTTTDGSVDYSVGNYDGSFKVKSVNAGTPTDRLAISSAGNVDIAGSVNIPTGSTYKINGVDLSILTTTDINNTSNYVLRLDGHTSNYVARVNTSLTTVMGTLQPTINSTAGQLIIGNNNGFTTTSTGLTWTGGNTLNATNLTTTTNLVVGGAAGIVGTSQFTGNVGIGTTSHATYKVDVNGTLNATSLLVNNNPISGSKWTTATDTTRIYYNTGNVGIGTTNPLQILQVGAGGRLRIANGNTDYSLIGCDDADAATNTRIILSGSSRTGNIGNVDYLSTSTGVHRFYTTSSGTERMRIYNNGAVGIQGTGNWGIAQGMTAGSLAIGNIGQNYGGQSGTVANMAGLMMECTDNTEIAVHDADTGVHSFMRYTTNGNFRIGRDMGWGVANLNITGPLLCNSYIECDATILSKSIVYARNTFDTLMYSNSTGMFLQMGNIGSDASPTYFKMGAYSAKTNFWSIGNRSIDVRVYIGALGGAYYGWEFLNTGTSYNAANTTTWNTISDHRIKEDIKKANLKICYDNVKNINLYRFNFLDGFKEGTKHDRTQLGYIAQQVSQHFPKSVIRSKIRLDDKREIPDLASVDVSQVNFTLFGAVKQLMRVVEKQSKRIKKLEEMLGVVDDDVVEDDTDEPYVKIECDEVDIDDIEPSEPEGV